MPDKLSHILAYRGSTDECAAPIYGRMRRDFGGMTAQNNLCECCDVLFYTKRYSFLRIRYMVRHSVRQRKSARRQSRKGGAWPWTRTAPKNHYDSDEDINTGFKNLDYHIGILEQSGCGPSHKNKIGYNSSVNRYYSADNCAASFQTANEYIRKLHNTQLKKRGSLPPGFAEQLGDLEERLARFRAAAP